MDKHKLVEQLPYWFAIFFVWFTGKLEVRRYKRWWQETCKQRDQILEEWKDSSEGFKQLIEQFGEISYPSLSKRTKSKQYKS